ASLNQCPVYKAVGGHAYGWVYSGPMGAVLIPNLIGLEKTGDLPNASTLCGKCEAVCPMRIPLPRMLRTWRQRQFEQKMNSPMARAGIKAWAFLARRPWLYRMLTRPAIAALARLGRARGRFRSLPLAGGWRRLRDFPAPEGGTFVAQWLKARRRDGRT
ncbi:MAG: lactate utilization protein, partial [Proteobacteria bacterium]|nr:lactate utilization protein [Pseudomonadota bacterium]